MKLMPCPLNGLRNISEFAYGGDVVDMPSPQADDQTWAQYLFYRDNTAGRVREWWCHIATAYWFIAERDTLSEEIIRTYPPDQLAKQQPDGASDYASDGGTP